MLKEQYEILPGASLMEQFAQYLDQRVHQMIVYNGHKRQHALKYQSITTPNGMIANLYGPVEGKRHDATIFRISGLMLILEKFFFGTSA